VVLVVTLVPPHLLVMAVQVEQVFVELSALLVEAVAKVAKAQVAEMLMVAMAELVLAVVVVVEVQATTTTLVLLLQAQEA
jgi:hypothetical protein